MIPRIFGPYEPLQGKAYTIDEYKADAEAAGFAQSVYVQANWRLEDSLKEVRVGPGAARAHGLAARDRRLRRPLRARRAGHDRRPAARPRRCCAAPGCSCTGTSTSRSASRARPTARQDETFNAQPGAAARARARLRAAGLPEPARVGAAARRGAPGPHVRADPRRHADRGRALARRADGARPAPERLREALRPGHVRAPRRPRADRRRDQGRARQLRLRPRDVRLQLPDREPVDRLF